MVYICLGIYQTYQSDALPYATFLEFPGKILLTRTQKTQNNLAVEAKQKLMIFYECERRKNQYLICILPSSF